MTSIEFCLDCVFYVSLYLLLGLQSYRLDMLHNVYSTPEALHNSKVTQELVNVMCKLFKNTCIDTI